MREGQNPLIRREDYAPPAFWIRSVDLTFDLDPAKTRVVNRMRVERNPARPFQPLRLDGEDLNLARVLINGESVSFRVENQQLVLENVPDSFELEILTTCVPDKNTQLMGLYVSNGSFFTQCEAEGFRRITYFLDRPDVMATYTVTLRADKTKYPVLLCNGNLVEHGDLPGAGNEGRHYAKWHDPFPKPSYLFALVAGVLVCREQRIRSRAGKDHLLQVYVRPGDLDKTEHAMNSLIASVLWDEARFGLALDLERFMIVAVGDFNMGAMENKGLNIFNTKYVLANPATATDTDYANIESVVGHEYFHNWTGNRVTCRDWFQLSLKEGLTVFRDQEFSQDMAGGGGMEGAPSPSRRGNAGASSASPSPSSARAVKRIEDVRVLRTAQFSEDAGPMAHPVRPDSYVEINNFYTATVYEKGAELVRMMQTLVGRDGFAAGLSLYFSRHDGQAVTCDDFAQAIADANPRSELAQRLTPFKRWYSQAGTPRLKARGVHQPDERSYTLYFEQSCAPSPGQPDKEPYVIPLALGLVSGDGRPVPLQLRDEAGADALHPRDALNGRERVFVISEAQQSLTFMNVDAEPVPSLLRGFSAPVVLEYDYSDPELLTLLAHDPDPFNRWEAGQRLALNRALAAVRAGAAQPLDESFIDAMRAVLRHPALDAAFKELVLTLPAETYIAEQLDVVDPQLIHRVREDMRLQLAQTLRPDWAWAWDTYQTGGGYTPDTASAGKRALANLALTYLCLDAVDRGDEVWPGKAYQRFKDAGNMTDRFGALSALVSAHSPLADPALHQFHVMFSHEALVIDKWFALQAGAPETHGRVFARVRQLMQHPDFSMRNPNRARSLITTLCHANPAAFHRADAAGYVFWADRVLELDLINPQVAARLARAMDRWRKLDEPYRSAAHEAISRVAAKSDLSSDVREVVERALAE